MMSDSDFRRIRVKEKFYSNILIGTIGFILVAAVIGYWAKESLARDQYFGELSYAGGGYINNGQAIYTNYSGGGGYAGDGPTGSRGFGSGCCGSGGGGGGCCGGSAGGGLTPSIDLSELERQGLEKYSSEKGSDQRVVAKAMDYGCHLQVDIYDETDKIVRSYGYRGDSLYVIQ